MLTGVRNVIAQLHSPPNRRLQLTAFGARDPGFFDSFCSAPRRQLKRRTLGAALPYTLADVLECS